MFFEEYKIGEAKFKCTKTTSYRGSGTKWVVYEKDDIIKLSSLNDITSWQHQMTPLFRNLRTDQLGNMNIATLKNFFVPV